MTELLKNRWIQLVVVGAVMAVLGSASTLGLSSGASEPVQGPVKLTTGGAVQRSGGGWLSSSDGLIGDRTLVELDLPLIGAEAVAAGWTDPILCSQGRGKYFKNADPNVPYFLMYDDADSLIGIYHISKSEMPPPWELTEVIFGGAGPVIEYEHWGLFFYFRDPTRACETAGPGVYMTDTG